MKTCKVCNKQQPYENFRTNNARKDKHDSVCRSCRHLEYVNDRPYTRDRNVAKCKKFYHKNKEYFGLYCKKYYHKNKSRRRAEFVRWSTKIKIDALSHYAGGEPKCLCCGETTIQMLNLDHINGGGNKERRTTKRGGVNWYSKLRQEGYPPGYQVMCFNCNIARHYNHGVCPHHGIVQNENNKS